MHEPKKIIKNRAEEIVQASTSTFIEFVFGNIFPFNHIDNDSDFASALHVQDKTKVLNFSFVKRHLKTFLFSFYYS